jgi:hypothetical protein
MRQEQKRLGEMLIQKGLLNQKQLEEVLTEQARSKKFLGEILIKEARIKEADLMLCLSEQFAMPFVSLADKYIDFNFVKTFSSSLILDYRCFPLERDIWSVTMAITNPLDVWLFKKAQDEAGHLKLKFVLILSSDMDDVSKRYRKYLQGNIL